MFKACLLAIGASALAMSASAQGKFESTSLGAIDPWGVGTLSRSDGALPNTLWNGSDAETLAVLLDAQDVKALSPSMRTLLRRVVLSSARRPDGETDNALLLKRLALIKALESRDTYANFVRQAPGVEGLESPFELRIDQSFARGNLASACSSVQATSQITAYIMNARAVCLALEGNISSAELALEFARDEGSQDIWFVTTIGSLETDKKKARPAAKYDNGLKLALSLGAELVIPAKGFTDMDPALALELVKRSDISRTLRIQSADIAAEAGLMTAEEYRNAYRTDPVPVKAIVKTIDGGEVIIPEEDENGQPKKNPNIPVNTLDEALQSANNAEIAPLERAALIDKALTEAKSSLARYRMTAQLLMPELQSARTAEIAIAYGEAYALAASVADNQRLASRIMQASLQEGAPEPDPFLSAWLDGIQIISGRDRSPQSARIVSAQLAETADEQQTGAALRMIAMIMALEGAVSPEARALIETAPEAAFIDGRMMSLRTKMSMESAYDAGAIAEGALRTTQTVGAEPALLSLESLSDLVTLLKDAGLGDIAREIALEGIRYHSPPAAAPKKSD